MRDKKQFYDRYYSLLLLVVVSAPSVRCVMFDDRTESFHYFLLGLVI